jgi:hypothetical protein
MQHVKSFGAAIAIASALFAFAAPAHAQATRTWVSGVGNDADPCSRTAPCKTFAGAISKTAINGIINCIDSGAYGAVTITKSITIDCHDVFASILNASQPDQPGTTTGVIINVGADPKDPWRTVRLRNIDISGAGSGNAGISIMAAAAVILEDLEVTGNVKQGIVDTRTEALGSALTIKNTVVANNAGAGISVAAQSNTVVLDNVQSLRNTYGLALGKNNSAAVARSVFSNNSTAGIEADPGAQLVLNSSVVSHNATGITSNGGPVAFADSDIVFNGTAISGATTSFGNSRIFGNGAPGLAPTAAGAATPALGQQ